MRLYISNKKYQEEKNKKKIERDLKKGVITESAIAMITRIEEDELFLLLPVLYKALFLIKEAIIVTHPIIVPIKLVINMSL